MTESNNKTDLQGHPLPKEKPGPKPKFYSKRFIVRTRISSAEFTKLQRLVTWKDTTVSDYLRDHINEDWKKFGHLTGRAKPRN
jgi:hypothetical protein